MQFSPPKNQLSTVYKFKALLGCLVGKDVTSKQFQISHAIAMAAMRGGDVLRPLRELVDVAEDQGQLFWSLKLGADKKVVGWLVGLVGLVWFGLVCLSVCLSVCLFLLRWDQKLEERLFLHHCMNCIIPRLLLNQGSSRFQVN